MRGCDRFQPSPPRAAENSSPSSEALLNPQVKGAPASSVSANGDVQSTTATPEVEGDGPGTVSEPTMRTASSCGTAQVDSLTEPQPAHDKPAASDHITNTGPPAAIARYLVILTLTSPLSFDEFSPHFRSRCETHPFVGDTSPSRCRLRPFSFLPASNPRGPPDSTVLTYWLSMMPHDGSASRPSAAHTRTRSASLISLNRPSRFHW
jgi:hypothetical protein